MSNIQLADNLRFLRDKFGLTQEALAEMLNVSRQAYSNYELGKRSPDLDTLLYLTRLYQVSLEDLALCNVRSLPSSVSGIAEEKTPYHILAKDKKTDNTIYLSEEELELILKFRTASEENRKITIGFLSNSNQS